MKSKLVKGIDYASLQLPDLTIEITNEDIEHEMQTQTVTDRMLHRFFVDEEVISEGSIVEVQEKNQKNQLQNDCLMIHIGLGLFDKDVETLLLGHSVGDEVLAGDTCYEIVSCKRRMLPELDDVFAKSLKLKGVETFSQYQNYLRNYFLDFYHREYMLYFAMEIFDLWQEESQWDIDEAEEEALFEQYLSMYPEIEDEESLAYQREEFEQLFYMMLSVNADPSCLMKLSECEAMVMRAVRPICDFISDQVTFDWKEEA